MLDPFDSILPGQTGIAQRIPDLKIDAPEIAMIGVFIPYDPSGVDILDVCAKVVMQFVAADDRSLPMVAVVAPWGRMVDQGPEM